MRRASAMSPSYGGQFEQMEIANIEYAFLTHIHSDHSGGLADLVLSPWVMGRDTELKLFGPKGLKDMVTKITEAYQLDIDYRLYGTQPANKKGFVSIVKEIEEGVIFKDTNVTVTAFYNNHGDLKESFGYLFETEDKKIIFSGDTAISDNLKKYSKGVDILVHEVYSSEGFKSKTADWKIYHKAHHTSSIDLGVLAKELNPKTLVPSHILFWGASEDSIMQDIKLNFSGKVILAEDLLVIE
jgi:ribonuclease Z